MSPSAARPILAPDHVGLIQALAASPQLRRQVIAKTEMLPAGAIRTLAGHRLEIEELLGHGMVGVTYRVRNGGTPRALKCARAAFGLFRELLRAERAAAAIASRALTVAPIVAAEDHAHLKELVAGPTLQRLIVDGLHEPGHRRALCEILDAACELLADDLHVDPSPKNLAWDGRRFVLLDPGEPLLRQDAAEHMWRAGSWQAYLRHHAPKLFSARSEPSALHAAADEPAFEATRWSFLREWELWLPHFDGAPERTLLALVDPERRADEIVYDMHRDADGWRFSSRGSDDPELRRRALDAWRARR